jgi:hypothetical protein
MKRIYNNWELWIAIFGLIIALIGAIPQIINWCNKTEIKGKLISNYGSFVHLPEKKLQQLVFVQKLSIFSKNNDFYLKDVKVFIKFPSSQKEIECKIWNWRDDGLKLKLLENDNPTDKTLKINPNEYINHFSVLTKNSSIVGYLSFSVDYQKDEKFEYVKYEFIDFNNKSKEFILNATDLESNKLYHDSSIWK